ncbi:MAG: winged helix-turn-helix domain-containing protein, partial [Gammaproteobacteria bacterium]|nr:winged helix-turn-helix domain-containing protein [Gammaproteobacteria bacterium]
MPTDPEQLASIRIGDWILLPDLNLIRHVERSAEVRLEPRHADLLSHFAAHAGEVLSADDIIEHVWNRQVVTDQSVYQAIAKLRRAVGDNANAPSYIETVPKRGYRLIAAVTAATDGTDRATPPPVTTDGSAAPPRRHRLGMALVALALVAVLAAVLQQQPVDAPQSYRTIVVMPFTMLSPEQDYRFIADGFAIELAHALGRLPSTRVIGPTSSQLAQRLGQDTREIGNHVDADVVVTGNVRRSDQDLRIVSTLTDARTGYQLWSEVFDRSDNDILATQHEVADTIAAALNHTVGDDADTPLPDMPRLAKRAHDEYLLGRYYRTLRTQPDLERSVRYFERALALEPGYLPAQRGLAAAYLMLSFYGDLPLADALELAGKHLERAFATAPEDAEVLALVGLSHYLQGSYGLGEDFLLRAVATHPNLAEAWMWLGLTRQQQGRLHEALPAFEHASQLEPLLVTSLVNYANALSWSGEPGRGLALLRQLAAKANEAFENRDQLFRTLSSIARETGDLLAADRWADRAIAAAPGSPLSLANKAVVSALLGDTASATQHATRARGNSAPGRATMDYLARVDIAAPGILDSILPRDNPGQLQQRPGTPEIEWRLANLYAGMRSYFDGDLATAIEALGKSMAGRNYPVRRADEDVFVCGALVDALQRSGAQARAAKELADCREDLADAEQQGWNSLS